MLQHFIYFNKDFAIEFKLHKFYTNEFFKK